MQQGGQKRLEAFGLEGKVAVVTGAASGIGAATAELFAEVGARVVVGDLNGEGAETTAASLRGAGAQAIGVQADVTDEAAVKAMFERARSAFGHVEVLVNNAAGRTKAAFMEMSVAEWDAMHAVTVRSAFLCSREAIRQMIESGRGGAIVNISSVASVHPMIFNNAHYDSAKAGVNALTRDCAIEFASHGVRVNAVLPGGTATPGGDKISANPALPLAGPALLEGRRPFGRRAEPSEMAQAILFLASPAASFITGQLLAVDGGYLVS